MAKTGEEMVVKAPAAPVSVAEAAAEAANVYDIKDLDAHAKAIAEAWGAKLKEQTRTYQKRVAAKAKAGTEAAAAGGSINWWNLLLAGPYQSDPPGPYTPNKILAANQPGFFEVSIWRNPTALGPGQPSPANIMSNYEYRVRVQTINLTTVAAGPAFVDPPMDQDPAVFSTGNVVGVGNINTHHIIFQADAFGKPEQGSPYLYEVNAVVDILGPGVGMPAFAGFSTWVLDPDDEPPFMAVIQGDWYYVPGTWWHRQFERPARFLVYV
jgi:hypothetical protein